MKFYLTDKLACGKAIACVEERSRQSHAVRMGFYRYFKMATIYLFILNVLVACAESECVDIKLGEIPLKVPVQYTSRHVAPWKYTGINFRVKYDIRHPDGGCVVDCDELLVGVSYGNTTPQQRWEIKKPQFTGELSGEYRVYRSHFDIGRIERYKDILVPVIEAFADSAIPIYCKCALHLHL